MSTDEDDNSPEDKPNLAFLPTDIVRKIIRVGQEYVDEMRLASFNKWYVFMIIKSIFD